MTEKQFKSLYEKHVRAIRNYLYYRCGDAALTDDLTQETFLRLWEKKFVVHPLKIKSLLYKIAYELFVDWVRKHRLQTDYIEQIKFQLQSDEPDTPDARAMLEKCEKCLAVLSENERVVFLLNKKDGFSQEAIAAQLGVSIKSIERWMSSAKQKIKNKKDERALQRNSVL